ncbi:MAG: SpoIID/LytB domain-containing protein [Lachnospiraceae bacterium]
MKNRILWKCMVVLFGVLGIVLLLFFSYSNGKAAENEVAYEGELLEENEKAYYEMEKAKTAGISEEEAETTAAEATAAENSDAQSARMIRVLLMDSDYRQYTQEKITLIPNGDYTINDGVQGMLSTGESVEITGESAYFQDGHMVLKPTDENSTVTVTSITRAQGTPSYSGILHIYNGDKGMWMVNELPLETYLAAVVPSEMPSGYAAEALKAQAVCARTYAEVQIREKSLEEYYADVDDSVSYQVYQNQPATAESIEAVESTKSQILCQNGQPIDAYYFSTSHGKTSTDQVWEAAVPAAYLQSVDCAYDQEEPWYRWQVTFSEEQLLQAVQRVYAQVKHIDRVEITARDEADTVIELQITDGETVYQVNNEYEIRSVLSPQGLTITRQDNTEVTGGALLPSAYFSIEEQMENDGTVCYDIRGGGYGHGVGLSQNGAQNMALDGMTYEEILHYFYKDVEICPQEE